ncbi:hypothetical protein HF520_06680 [Romboutsia sp. CE17]|uniref:DUF6179 domain-containing protein n=1 Tax=Romboutsia sp. CE17 TaxID=2724150 RepID=UPI001442C372|nr:DUF6179 domain-containing protein [Romboutsia sp. CE17]QJA08643.1 hypothetical protein HF520_06680 [Romboutsia sp. CE17]
MNLQTTNYEFNINNIDKNQYYISLVKECIKANIIDNKVIYTTQLELGKLLKEIIMKYTKGESSSVTNETAEKLLIAIWYTIDAYLSSFDNIEDSIEVIKNKSLEKMYNEGKIILKEKFEITKELYEKTIENKLDIEIIAYNDTLLEGIKAFFVNYDIKFEPHDAPGSIDYPLAFDDWSVKGLNYIKNYLENINIENRICRYFDQSSIKNMLEQYGRMYHINYRDLLINVFELTITNAVFSFIINRNYKTLEINEDEFMYLEENLKNLNNDISKLIDLCVDKIIDDFNIVNEDEINYLKRYKKVIINSTISGIKNNNFKNILVITKNEEIPKNRFIIEEENSLDDDEFKNIIEAIIEEDNIFNKINIIKSKINSIKDFIDMLESDCLFKDEYTQLFNSLTNLELSILGKFIFNEECRMNKLKLKDVIYSEFDINNEWEYYYIEFIKSLDEDRINSIEISINDMNEQS